MANYSPPFRNPFTDISASLLVQQHWGRCAFFEMRFMECLEAYGADRGIHECKLQQADFNECLAQRNQKLRVIAMRKERERQAKEAGKSKKDAYLPPPPKDAYTFLDQN